MQQAERHTAPLVTHFTMSKLQLFQDRFQSLLKTDPSYEDIILVPLILTFEAVRYLIVTLAPIALALLLVFTPYAVGWEDAEPVMFVTTLSAERAQKYIENQATYKNTQLNLLNFPSTKKFVLRQVPNTVLARLCDMRGIAGVHPTDRDNMINRLSQS